MASCHGARHTCATSLITRKSLGSLKDPSNIHLPFLAIKEYQRPIVRAYGRPYARRPRTRPLTSKPPGLGHFFAHEAPMLDPIQAPSHAGPQLYAPYLAPAPRSEPSNQGPSRAGSKRLCEAASEELLSSAACQQPQAAARRGGVFRGVSAHEGGGLGLVAMPGRKSS